MANHAKPFCGNGDEFISDLTEKYGEMTLFNGVSTLHPGWIMEAWSNQDSTTWTIIVYHRGRNIRCTIEMGMDFQPGETETFEVPLVPDTVPPSPTHFHDQNPA
jgi:hypothetical protein